jgi:hypothetical protein
MAEHTINELERMATEDTQKWLLDAVVGLNLCPFAKAVVVKDMVRYRVCASSQPADVPVSYTHLRAHETG